MQVNIKTAGLLGRYLPPGSQRNRGVVELPEGTSAQAAMDQLGFPQGETYLVSLNGTVVPVAERAGTVLNPGDQLAIMPPLRGG